MPASPRRETAWLTVARNAGHHRQVCTILVRLVLPRFLWSMKHPGRIENIPLLIVPLHAVVELQPTSSGALFQMLIPSQAHNPRIHRSKLVRFELTNGPYWRTGPHP